MGRDKRWADQIRELSYEGKSFTKKITLESDDNSLEESDDSSEDSESSIHMQKRECEQHSSDLNNNNKSYPSQNLSRDGELKKVVKRTILQILEDGSERYTVEYLIDQDDIERVENQIKQKQKIKKPQEEGKVLLLQHSASQESTVKRTAGAISKKDEVFAE